MDTIVKSVVDQVYIADDTYPACVEFTFEKPGRNIVVIPLKSGEFSATFRLDKPDLDITIVNLAYLRGQEKCLLKTVQEHAAVRTKSRLLVKTIVTDTAEFTFDGLIRIQPGAEESDAYQRNDNLVVSASAQAITRPALEIFSGNVRCTHAATVSSLPKDQMWYLESRGVREVHAREMILEGFMKNALESFGNAEMEQEIYRRIGINFWKGVL